MGENNSENDTDYNYPKKRAIILASIEREVTLSNQSNELQTKSKKKKKRSKRITSSFPERPYANNSDIKTNVKVKKKRKKDVKQQTNLKNRKKISSEKKMKAMESYYKRMIRKFTIASLIFLFFSIAGFLILGTQFQKAIVNGKSMEPTLYPDDKVLYQKKAEVKRFDIVVFPPTSDSKDLYVKRIIGMPGETLYYKDDTLYVNHLAVEEPYIESIKKNYESSERTYYTQDFELDDIPNFSSEDGTIPDGFYLVLGDNRDNSTDSRMIGLISEDLIRGVVRFRYSPLSRFGFV